jgi:hypothetical protein
MSAGATRAPPCWPCRPAPTWCWPRAAWTARSRWTRCRPIERPCAWELLAQAPARAAAPGPAGGALSRWRRDPTSDAQRADDEALMRRAWAAGLTALARCAPPRRDARLRVLCRPAWPATVSEAGPGRAVLACSPAISPTCSRCTVPTWPPSLERVAAGPRRTCWCRREPRALRRPGRDWPDLHLVLWNPYQALDVAAPALLSWGYAGGALAAVRDWLARRGPGPGPRAAEPAPHDRPQLTRSAGCPAFTSCRACSSSW